jgi:hypothetical protein
MLYFLFCVVFISALLFEEYAVLAAAKMQGYIPVLRQRTPFDVIHSNNVAINFAFGTTLAVFFGAAGGATGFAAGMLANVMSMPFALLVRWAKRTAPARREAYQNFQCWWADTKHTAITIWSWMPWKIPTRIKEAIKR